MHVENITSAQKEMKCIWTEKYDGKCQVSLNH